MLVGSRFFLILSFCALGSAPLARAYDSHSPPKTPEVIEKFDKKLDRAIGECACATDPASHEADSKVLGKIPVRDFRGEELPISVVNDEYALRLFQEVTMQKKIPFGFPEDGCFARAYEMSYQFARKGILTGKVFAHGVFRLADDKAKKGAVTWSFHVAPFLVVDTGKEKQIWVIDPSLFYEPATLRAWLEALTVHPKSSLKNVYFTDRYVYHHANRDRRLTDFDPDDLKKAQRLMKRYRKRQNQRERKTTDHL